MVTNVEVTNEDKRKFTLLINSFLNDFEIAGDVSISYEDARTTLHNFYKYAMKHSSKYMEKVAARDVIIEQIKNLQEQRDKLGNEIEAYGSDEVYDGSKLKETQYPTDFVKHMNDVYGGTFICNIEKSNLPFIVKARKEYDLFDLFTVKGYDPNTHAEDLSVLGLMLNGDAETVDWKSFWLTYEKAKDRGHNNGM